MQNENESEIFRHLRQELLRRHSKENTLNLTAWIGTDPVRFERLLQLILANEKQVSQRAAWVLSHCADAHPELILPHFETLLRNLENPIHVAVKRNTLKVLADHSLPENLLGIAADLCFTFLADQKEPVAVRVHAMTILWNICKKEPDLSPELQMVIEDQLPYGSAGFKNRGQKILNWIRKNSYE